MPFVIFISVLLPVFGLADGQISRVEGMIFWILFIAFLMYLLNMSKKGAVKVEEETDEKKERTIPQLIFLSIIGLILIVWGSNIFNILFVLGTTALIIPVPYAANFLIDSIVCVASVAVLLLCVLRKQKLTKSGGIIMLLMYAGYVQFLLLLLT